jgi:hypothetical protein
MGDILSQATSIGPQEKGLTAWLDRVRNNAKGLLSGGGRPDAAVDIVGGPALGPLNVAHGLSLSPSHPIRGANEVVRGVGQTVALPLAVANPGMMAYAAPAIGAQAGTQTVLNKAGVDPDYAELAGNLAGIGAGGLTAKALSPKSAPVPSNDPSLMGLLKREVLAKTAGKLPFLGRNFKAPTVGEYLDLLTKPKNAPDTPDVVQPTPQPSAPYRLSGKQITDPVTITGRPPFLPKGLLQAAPEDIPAAEAKPAAAKPSAPVEDRGIKAPQQRTFLRTTEADVKQFYNYRFDQLRGELEAATKAGDEAAMADAQRRISQLDQIQRTHPRSIMEPTEPPAPTPPTSALYGPFSGKSNLAKNQKQMAKAGIRVNAPPKETPFQPQSFFNPAAIERLQAKPKVKTAKAGD